MSNWLLAYSHMDVQGRPPRKEGVLYVYIWNMLGRCIYYLVRKKKEKEKTTINLYLEFTCVLLMNKIRCKRLIASHFAQCMLAMFFSFLICLPWFLYIIFPLTFDYLEECPSSVIVTKSIYLYFPRRQKII